MPYVNNKGTDQPVHLCNLISVFVVHCLDSIIPLVSTSEISSLYLASVAAQAGLSLPWSQTMKRFSHDEAPLLLFVYLSVYSQLFVVVVVCSSLTSLSTIFHITTVSGCDRELNAHFHTAISLKYHAPDT